MKPCRYMLNGWIACLCQMPIPGAAAVIAVDGNIDFQAGGRVEVETSDLPGIDVLDRSGVGGTGVTLELLG